MSATSDEAGRLVQSVQDWLTDAAKGAHGGLDTGSPECGVCPLCMAVGMVRRADPQVVVGVVDALGKAAVLVSDALRDAADRMLATDPDAATTARPADDAGTDAEGDDYRSGTA